MEELIEKIMDKQVFSGKSYCTSTCATRRGQWKVERVLDNFDDAARCI